MLWPEQRRVAQLLQDNRLVVVLKARQLGLTWLVLAFALWLMLFHPIATMLLFSRRDEEATDLLAVRLRGMYDRLPQWLKVQGVLTDNEHEWALSNGSRALAFPTTAGDSYTATALQGRTGWVPVFLPWHARPERTAAWYEAQRRDILARTAALDDLAEQYPTTDAEALAPRSLDKRLPAEWLQRCYRPQPPLTAAAR